jgi:flagellar basal body-associated protein FliL
VEEFGEVLLDVQKEYKRSNKLKDIIIIILIVLMFLQSAFSFGCFVWYESQFEYYDTVQETNAKDVDIETRGDSANAEYNDVSGNQYNDNAVHNQGGEN